MAKRKSNSKRKTGYNITKKKLEEVRSAITKYNKAVRSARKQAGFDDYELDGLAMPTTLPNVKRRITSTKQANAIIKNLMEYTKPGGTDFVYKVDKETGEVTDIRFKAQEKQLKREVTRENKLRRSAREAAKNTDTRIYNPNIDIDIRDVDTQEIEKRRGTGPIDLATTNPIIQARTDNWKRNYVNRLEQSIMEAQTEHGILQKDINRIRALEQKIMNASIDQVNYMIYNENRGDIRSGPYTASVTLFLDILEAEWDRALSDPWNDYGEDETDDFWEY